MLASVALLAVSSVSVISGASAVAVRGANGNVEPNYWFSFGDSYTTTGFIDNGTLPVPGNPLGNPAYPGYTAVGGTNWIDVDTVVYNKSLILTYNYAYNGATINASLVAPYYSTTQSLVDQVNEFLTTAAKKPASTPWSSENSLFSIWIGINDIGYSYYNNGSRSAFSDVLLNNEFALVEKLALHLILICNSNAGARNFLWNNVPPMDRTPQMLAGPASAQALEKSVIDTFNDKLADKISEFKITHPGVRTYLWDSNSAFTTILNDPTKYGFVDATSYGAPGDFWALNSHPSSAAHDIFGQEVAAVLKSTVW